MEFTLSNRVAWLPNAGWDPRIHIAANADLVNVFMIVTTRYVVLVDTLLNAVTAGALLDGARPYLDRRQLLVVNSHADWDHAWGNMLFGGPQARYPAPIIAHAAGVARHSNAETVELLAQSLRDHPDIFAGVRLTPPTLTFLDTLWIHGGDLTLHLFHTPGHTADHIAIFIPEISTLLAGDAAEIPFPYVDLPSDLPILRASLQMMADLHPQHALYCHAPPGYGPQLLHDNLAYYAAIERACREARARGIDPTSIPDAELPALLNCPFETVTPSGSAWRDLSDNMRLERHGEQLRLMLGWLAGSAN